MSEKVMFLDESGDHNLLVIDSTYPVFVLGGVIIDREYANGELEERVRRFKRDLFGRDDLILHTADITRNRNGFERMTEAAFRKQFYARLNTLMSELEYTVVACVIKKEEHLANYGLGAIDPYLLSLNILVERFCFEIGDTRNGGMIVAEKRRDPILDRELELAWRFLNVQGTRYVRAATISKRIAGLTAHAKRDNIAGLQLADLVVTPIGRFIIGKANHDDWAIVESKFRQHRGDHIGAGLVVLPKQK